MAEHTTEVRRLLVERQPFLLVHEWRDLYQERQGLRVLCLVEKAFSVRIRKFIEVCDHGLRSLKMESCG